GLELPLRRLRAARPPIEFVTQGAVAQRPCLQLGARLLLLLREKLTAAFQLAEFGLDRCALALLLVTLLLASESIRLESGLRFARAEQRRAVLRVQRFELSDGLRGRRPLMVCRLLPGERLA